MAICSPISIHLNRAIEAADQIIEQETLIEADTSQPAQRIAEATQRIAETNAIRTALLNVYDAA